MSLSNYLENKLVNHAFGGTAYTQPTLYLALFTADPTETGSFTNEVANSNAYARIPCPGSISNNVFTMTANQDFVAASGGNWGTITHVAIVDSATHGTGNVLASEALIASKVINNGDQYRQTLLTVTLD